MGYSTLPQRLLDSVDRVNSPRAQIHKVGGQWKDIAAQEMLRRIAGLSAALAELGVREGDRVAIFAPNCPEWHVADFAVLGLGAVVVPIYFRESPERIEYIVGHAEPKVIFVAGVDQTARLLGMRGRLSGVERVIVANAGTNTGAVPHDAPVDDHLLYDTLIARAGDGEVAAYRKRAADLHSDLLASIIYTSGTTGEPKGVMLSHANFVSNDLGAYEGFPYGPDDLALSFLPLAHVYERLTDYGFLFRGIPLAYLERPEDVSHALVEMRPTITAAVPRFFEKLYAVVIRHADDGPAPSPIRLGHPCRASGCSWRAYGRPVSASVKLQWQLADRLVYKKFRAGIGRRIRQFVSGGAPLALKACRILQHGWRADLSRIWADGDFSRRVLEQGRGKPGGHRRAADS